MMNKYKSALSDIMCCVPYGKLKEQEETLKELVELATSKSPNFNRGIEVQSWDGDCCSRGYTHDYWSCPNCDGYLCKVNDEDAIGEYCTQCGQRIVGSEEDGRD